MKTLDKRIMSIEKITGHRFEDSALIRNALTHVSGNKFENYEKLEFLGDAVLQLAISNYLFQVHSYLQEGEMTVTRAYAVCGDTLAKVGRKLSLDKLIIIGPSGLAKKINNNDSVIADVFEAITGALYLEAGMESASRFVIEHLNRYIIEYIKSGDNKDYKTRLQHLTQELYSMEPEYILKSEKGPDHDKTFIIEVYVNKKASGRGKGNSKKKAQQGAAEEALKKYDKKGKF
ncbi:MAG: ribonuclease III [Clostridia bacterium]